MLQISLVGHEGAGKDTSADMLQTIISNSVRYSHAAALKTMTAKMLSITVEELERAKRDNDTFSMTIDNTAGLPGTAKTKTARDWLIYVSEELVKPIFGNDIWASALQALLKNPPEGTQAVIKSDDRYPVEFDFENTVFVFIDKPGVTGDSTTPYWEHINALQAMCAQNTDKCLTIVNDGTLEELRDKLVVLAQQKGWVPAPTPKAVATPSPSSPARRP